MITLLSCFQFVFLYVPILFIGMAVYGTDIKSTSGYIYIVTLIIISLILLLLKKQKYPVFILRQHKIISIFGGLLALILYKDLHFKFWDEHSIYQASLIFGIGICACLSSINASLLMKENKLNIQMTIQIILLFSINGLLSIYYPMISFFFIALILLIWPLFTPYTKHKHKYQFSTDTIFSRYLIFMIFFDLPLIIWDFKVNSLWGNYMAISLLGCALGFIMPRNKKFMQIIMTLFLSNFLYCAFQAEYILNPIHSLITGLALSTYLNYRINQNNNSLAILPAIAAPAIVGFILSILFYSNLDVAVWRGLFTLPILIYFLKTTIFIKQTTI